MKNNKGITLISLVVMIIIILILASVALTTGVNVIRQSKYNRAVSEMKTMQTKVNNLYEDYKGENVDNIADFGTAIEDISPSLQSKAETAIQSVKGNINNKTEFRFFSSDYIKSTFNLDGIEGDYLVNIKTREVILIDGIKNDGEMYYSLSQIENEQFNVEFINPTITYSPDGGKYILPKNITSEKTLNMNIELSLQDIPNSMTANDLTIKYAWSTSKDSEPSSGWVQLQNGTTISENGESNIDSAGEYYLWTKVEDENGKTLNTIVSKKYTVKDEYDVKVRVAFDANGGTVETNNKNAINQEPYGDLPTPTRTGYEFNGWYTDKTGETKVEETDNVELDESNLPPTQPQSQTLYAGWTANQYDVVFNDKLPDEYQEVEYITSNVSSSSHPYINTHILPNSNMRVILKGKTGNQITSAGFLFGSRVTMHQQRFWGIIDQSKYRYGLGNGLNVNIASATTSQDFTFDFNFNESHSMKVNSLTTDSVTINDTNYNFPIFLFGLNNNGTLDSSQQKSFSVYEFTIYNSYEDVNPIMKLIPCYRRIDNEIGMYDLVEKRFYTNAGTGEFAKGPETMPKQQFTYDTAQNITTNGYIKEGYSFTGWNTNSDGTGTSYTDGQSVSNLTAENNGTVNLYAQWEANKYKVKFNSNEGTGTMSDQQFTYDTAQNLITNTFTRTGYTFAGWNTKADGSGTSYTEGQSVNNLISDPNGEIVLYAQWTPNQYDVVFNGNRLPSEYQEVEYIRESNATAFINTGIIPNRNMRVVFKGKTSTRSNIGYLFGTKGFFAYTLNNRYLYHLGGVSQEIESAKVSQDFVLDFNYNETHDMKISKDGSEFISVTGPAIPESETYTRPIFVSGRNDPGSTNNAPPSVYEFIIYNHYADTNPSLHLIPCYRKSDNVIGMYDLVNNSFYSNAGTGAFEKGPDGTHQRFTYGTAQNLTVNTYTRDGYRFTGWNTVANGTGTSYTDGQEANNLTSENNGTVNLYAQWEENNYTVVFRKNELQHELPGEFRELEYIEGTGTQWINTNYALWNDSNWKIENKFEISEHYNYNNMFGPADVSEITNEVWIASDKNYYVRLNGTGKIALGALDINTPYTFTLDNTGSNLLAYINGKQEKVLTKANTSTPRNIAYAHREGVNYFKGKTYYLKFWSNGNLVRDFIPCYSTIQITDANGKECPSGTAGLYDTVNDLFYASSGEEEFTRGTDLTGAQEFSFTNPQNLNANTFTRAGYTFAGWNTKADGSGISYTNGQSVNSLTTDNNGIVSLYAQWTPNQYNVVFNKNKALPNGYQEVEYIEGTGTQYINTNYKLWENTNWKIENKFDVTGHYNYNNMFGLSGVTDTNNEMWIDNSRNYYIRVGGVPKTSIGTIDLNKPYTITFDNTGINLITYVNGTFTNSLIKSNTNRDYNLLYGHRDGATYLKGKTYYLKLWSNGSLVRDFVPCYRISDGEAGLFDIIENNFYPSAGSGKFVKGPDVTSTINGTMATQQLTYGTSQNLTSNSYTREGSTFDGWRDDKGNLYTDGQSVNSLTTENGGTVNLYAQWTNYQAYFDGNNSSSKLAEITDLTNIKRFEKYTGDNSNVQALINNGTAVKIDDNTTLRSIYAWYDENGNDDISDNEDDNTIYWWTNADRACLLDKSHYMWKDLTNAEYIDVTGIDTKDITKMDQMFSSTGYNVTTFEIVGLNTINTSNVINMNNMFLNTGYNATTWTIGDLSQWNTSNVTTMQGMFSSAGFKATTFDIENIGNWNTENVTNMYNLFFSAGRNATSWNIGNIGNWNVSKVTNMSSMFQNAGYKATTWSIGDIGSWNTSNVINMTNMFNSAGYSASTWNIGDISNWNTSKVTSIAGMFNNAGYSATIWDVGNLERKTVDGEERWNTSNVTNMQSVFRYAGNSATEWNIGNIGNWNVSKVIFMHQMFQGAGYSATTWSIGDIGSWNTSNVTNMSSMFQDAGRNASTWNIGDIGSWNTSNVTYMQSMFSQAGYKATSWSIGDIGNWNLSNVTNMAYMFQNSGYIATTWNIGDLSGWLLNTKESSTINMSNLFLSAGYSANTWNIGDIGNWNTLNVTTMNSMFYSAGNNAATWYIGDLSRWNTSNVTDMRYMFANAGRNATVWNIGNLSEWNTSKVNSTRYMFVNAGYNTTNWSIGNILNWNLSSATDMGYMFNNAGYNSETFNINLSSWILNNKENNTIDMNSMFSNAGYSSTTWNIGNLSNWNTSNVTNMSSMFRAAGYNAETWGIGDLSNWNTSKVSLMENMFQDAGHEATTWNTFGSLDIYARSIRSIFYGCPGANGTLNIYVQPGNIVWPFYAAATSGPGIVVNYTSAVTNIDDIIASKSANSNIIKGILLDSE